MVILTVHCHVGSLEMTDFPERHTTVVHCHVGSLEIVAPTQEPKTYVHCHVGSLEKQMVLENGYF